MNAAAVSAISAPRPAPVGGAVTGGDGSARVPLFGTGPVRVVAQGQVDDRTLVEYVDVSPNDDPVVVVLGQTPRNAELGGIVIGPDGKGVAGAKVAAWLTGATHPIDARFRILLDDGEGCEARTDAAGRFVLNGLREGGEYAVYVEAPDLYLPDRAIVAAVGNLDLRVSLSRPPPQLFVTGRLLSPDGTPSQKYFVGGQEQANPKGRFRVPWTPQLEFTAPGYPTKLVAVTARGSHDVGDVRLAAPEVITGKVLDARRHPVSAATVSFAGRAGQEARTVTDAEGAFRLPPEYAPPVVLEVSSEAGTAQHRTDRVEDVEIVLPPSGTILGAVPPQSTEATATAICREGLPRQAATHHGRFAIRGVQGRCLVLAGTQLIPQWAQVPADGVVRVVFPKREGRGRVIALVIRPSHYAGATLLPGQVAAADAHSILEGGIDPEIGDDIERFDGELRFDFHVAVFDFEGLPPGRYTLFATDSREAGMVEERHVIDVGDGIEVINLRFLGEAQPTTDQQPPTTD